MRRQVLGILLSLGVYGAMVTPSGAPLLEVPYEEFAEQLERKLSAVAVAEKLDIPDYREARRAAATWVYIGPCKGNDLPMTEGGAIIGYMINADPSRPFDASVLQMVAFFISDNLGREPGEFTCRYAKQIAGTPR